MDQEIRMGRPEAYSGPEIDIFGIEVGADVSVCMCYVHLTCYMGECVLGGMHSEEN